jgi:cytochrome c oxidase cbb3-type subunit 3
MTMPHRVTIAAGCCALAAASLACERESRPFRDLPVAAARSQVETQTTLHAGAPAPPTGPLSPYQENAWGISEGKRFFTLYNCAGCHANGGGGIGPPLMDDEWIYGFEQVWQLVAYVQSLSGQTPIDASPGRSDHMRPYLPEALRPYGGRTQTGHK